MSERTLDTVSLAFLSEVLQSYVPKTLGGERLKPAAVLVPIQSIEGKEHLILTQRQQSLNSHGGEIAFPGGAIDPADAGPLDTALRESQEEIGLHPRDVKVLGQLDQVTTSSTHLVTPFVGLIPFPYDFCLNKAETEAVFSVPISALLEAECFYVEIGNGHPRPIDHFRHEGYDIWGATARIIKQLLELAYGFTA